MLLLYIADITVIYCPFVHVSFGYCSGVVLLYACVVLVLLFGFVSGFLVVLFFFFFFGIVTPSPLDATLFPPTALFLSYILGDRATRVFRIPSVSCLP